ncbi:MAG: hypothetical protein V1792_00180 [Pseudomonadota bacterium]
MSDHPEQDVTTQLLIQIRDEMRSMGARLEKRLDSLEARMESLETRMESLETRLETIETRLETIDARLDSLEARIDSLESRNEADHKRLFKRFDQIDADLKRFVGIVNDAILHYADEMDSVRERLDILEKTVGISPRSE